MDVREDFIWMLERTSKRTSKRASKSKYPFSTYVRQLYRKLKRESFTER